MVLIFNTNHLACIIHTIYFYINFNFRYFVFSENSLSISFVFVSYYQCLFQYLFNIAVASNLCRSIEDLSHAFILLVDEKLHS